MTPEQLRAGLARMNPDTLAGWLAAGGPSLTETQHRVLAICLRNGGYVAAGNGEHKGSVERVPASAVLALIRRGYLAHCYGPDGGVAGRLTGRALLLCEEQIEHHNAQGKP